MPNEASVYTKNAQKLSDRQFDEDSDSKRTNRGLIAKAKALIVKDSGGHVVKSRLVCRRRNTLNLTRSCRY